jgi:hypothetical protein
VIIRVPRVQAEAILGAMRRIALTHGPPGVTDGDRRTIEAAAQIVLGLEDAAPGDLAPCAPERLAAVLPDEADARQAVRMLAVMSLVDGRVDPEKTALVAEYADALDGLGPGRGDHGGRHRRGLGLLGRGRDPARGAARGLRDPGRGALADRLTRAPLENPRCDPAPANHREAGSSTPSR